MSEPKEPAKHSFGLILMIDGKPYRVERCWPDATEFRLCWHLFQPGKDGHYQVILHGDGRTTCDCPDSSFRPGQASCKHREGLKNRGIFPRDP